MAEEALVAAGGEIPLPDTPPAANQALAIAQATKVRAHSDLHIFQSLFSKSIQFC